MSLKHVISAHVEHSESQACIVAACCNGYGGAHTRRHIMAAIKASRVRMAMRCALTCADHMISNGEAIVRTLAAK